MTPAYLPATSVRTRRDNASWSRCCRIAGSGGSKHPRLLRSTSIVRRGGSSGPPISKNMEPVQIGIIGGSGLYDMAEVTDRKEVTLTTPFGEPSGPYILGTLRGKRVAFLARHGAGHRFSPSELNFRANIFGMKMLGVEYILSASAVGSLKEEYRPADIVIPDQFFDRTKGRPSSFFGRGLVGHVGFAHPFCRILSDIAFDSGKRAGATVHKG